MITETIVSKNVKKFWYCEFQFDYFLLSKITIIEVILRNCEVSIIEDLLLKDILYNIIYLAQQYKRRS